MFMMSLNQSAGIGSEERESLDAITADLLQFIQLKSHRLYMHSLQVANYSVSVAAKLALPKSEIEQIKHAALLHDVGLLFVSNTLLAKIPYLNRSEKAMYKRHAAAGGNMIENIPCCQDIIPYIVYHHERWDGSGFPKHLRGANIPLGARIIAVADYYDTIINPSTEFWAKTKTQAVRELFSASGLLFDPEIVKAFIETLG
ncbi:MULTISPECIES: HD-GYP domain-containing protein [Megasphaera]|jgi:HD-GYP domain-containing protein (c-di-GMP phosphodiesterase class II)|uniref:HD domain-containing protein n=2 Tax=Megasphaera TaxID=906 RepID=A0A848BSK8_9FIRM|nr:MULTISPECIES: HD domain-containing phosphohydrolase [Megasphaera]MDY2904137.1 HD domain-containing phosphohydrolase [Caecibacter massiliensis]HAM04349.1 HD domain-containing protein [Megasphaera sp.]AXB80857.1 phosphohydrolase [Megasphaera hexanoica]KUH55926.1 phosphohydrolase [Megasphaera sp. DJF_B143]NME28150.1 HD domain-containing protein [Megasphaera hexanoica]